MAFKATLNAVVPWHALCEVIERHCPSPATVRSRSAWNAC
jgi:hypothetical protein